MRAVIQRVSKASVAIEGDVLESIDKGLLVYLGIDSEDTREDVNWLCGKIPQIRIFPDSAGLMNRSLLDCGGEVLVISQFTLFGSLRKGTRPSFNRAASPEVAFPIYEAFVLSLEEQLGKPVAKGEFGALMRIELINEGPVTLFIDSKNRKL